MFSTEENISKYNGVFESPRALKTEVVPLYKNIGRRPKK